MSGFRTDVQRARVCKILTDRAGRIVGGGERWGQE